MRHLFFVLPLCAVAAACSRTDSPPAPATVPPTEIPAGQSKFFESFDTTEMRKKYIPKFEDNLPAYGGLSNAVITPPGRIFKKISFDGQIAEATVDATIARLRVDLPQMARDSGVTLLHEPDDRVVARPYGLMVALFMGREHLNVGKMRGFYFTYGQGSQEYGAVDVVATVVGRHDEKQEWMIVIAIHEPERKKPAAP